MWGELAAAAGNIIGGLFGQNAADKQMDMQKEFAQKGIRWRVNDAQKAGIHPLYALGANTTSYSPVSVGGDLASGISAAGENIGRAVSAGMTPANRYEQLVQALTVKRLGLENDKLASEIRLVNQAGNPPGVPSVVGPAGAGLALPSGDIVPVGPGASADAVQSEYGEISDLEGGARYIRDRVPPYVGINGTKTPILSVNGQTWIPMPSDEWWSGSRNGRYVTPYGR